MIGLKGCENSRKDGGFFPSLTKFGKASFTMGRTPEELLVLADINPELDQVSSFFIFRLQPTKCSRS
jgi:hypothetical protein